MTPEPGDQIELPAEEVPEPEDAGIDEVEIAEIPTPPVSSRPVTSVVPVPAPKLTPTIPTISLVAVRCNWPDNYRVRGKVTGTQYEFSGGKPVPVKQSDVLGLLSREAPNLNVPLFERV